MLNVNERLALPYRKPKLDACVPCKHSLSHVSSYRHTICEDTYGAADGEV